jgi:uncharacterized protein involved in exopolysaccharide biosynthesis
VFKIPYEQSASSDRDAARERRLRLLAFLSVLVAVAGGGLLYDYSRPALFRASARLSVTPPGGGDALATAQFAVSEAQAIRRSEYMQAVERKLAAGDPNGRDHAAVLERLTAEALPQTGVIELRAEGADRNHLVAALSAWTGAYVESRKETDRQDETEAVAEARHALRTAQEAIEAKRRDMEAFRQRSGITSVERDENPGAARLKGLYTALNDSSTREVNAESKLKAIDEAIAQGRGFIRSNDKSAIAQLEMRAVDLREKMKDLEHDYTAQYLSMDPKFKALKANLARIEQQVEQERARSQKAALMEAQEDFASAQRAAQKIREQANGLKQESQAFSVRFVELKRMGVDLDQLQDTRRQAAERLAKLESARKPMAVKVRVLSTPSAAQEPFSPDYARDAAIAIGAGLLLAIGAVWLLDYLRRDPRTPGQAPAQPIIQIAYPMLQPQAGGGAALVMPPAGPAGLIGSASSAVSTELAAEDISALYHNAGADGRLVLAALFGGLAPAELSELKWKQVSLERGFIDVPGPSARRLTMVEPIQRELQVRSAADAGASPEAFVLADGLGQGLSESDIDNQLVCMAHDAGLRHPEDVTGKSLHFTYAAFLARQGMKMADLSSKVGRMAGAVGAELIRLAPPGRARPAEQVDCVYPSFRLA